MTMPEATRVRGQAPDKAHPQAPDKAPALWGTPEGSDTQAWVHQRPATRIGTLQVNSSTERGTDACDPQGRDVGTQIRPFSCVSESSDPAVRPLCADPGYIGLCRRLTGRAIVRGPCLPSMRGHRQQALQQACRPPQGRRAPQCRGRNRNPGFDYGSTRIPSTRSAITKIQICRGSRGVSLYPQRTRSSSRLNPPPTLDGRSLTPRWCRPRREGVQHG